MRVSRAAVATAVAFGVGAAVAPAAHADAADSTALTVPVEQLNPVSNWFGPTDLWYAGGSFGGSGTTSFGGSGDTSFGGSGS
ncbi:hypothetical protein [Streptodolium elevatio]|uniref:Uncharacterized protein n=1 Tax=Streptodolium elevatio TaxID=3157996 RepID=A0ABV3D9H3_9ACTN